MSQIVGKINENGMLEIKRGRNFKKQLCPYPNDLLEVSLCGDHCPFFSEPINCAHEIQLSLCQTVWYFNEFNDERIGSKNE